MKKYLLFGVLALALFLPRAGAFADVAFDSYSTDNGSGTASLSYSHTVSGSDTALVVGVMTDETVTGVTYDGVSMTPVNSVVNFPSDNNEYLYYLTNPSTGSHNVIVTTSASATIYSDAASYTGVSQTGQPEENNTATTTGASLSAAVTTTSDNNWLVGAFRNGAGDTTAGADTTLRGTSGPFNLFDSNGPKNPARSYSLSVTISNSQTAGLVLSLAPVGPTTCISSAVPAVCGSFSAGSVAMQTGSTTLTVDTTAVTADNQIFVIQDASLGSLLDLTCNTNPTRVYSISARTAGTSFTVTSSGDVATNNACLSYFIVN